MRRSTPLKSISSKSRPVVGTVNIDARYWAPDGSPIMSSTAGLPSNLPGDRIAMPSCVAIEPRRLLDVVDRKAHPHFDHVGRRSGRGGGERIGLVQLDEVAVGILHDDRARPRPARHGNRFAALRHDWCAKLRQPAEDGIEVADEHDQHEGAAVLEPPFHGRPPAFEISTISTPVRMPAGRPIDQRSCASGRPNMLRSAALASALAGAPCTSRPRPSR